MKSRKKRSRLRPIHLSFIVTAILIVFAIINIQKRDYNAYKIHSVLLAEGLASATSLYEQTHSGHLPLANNWEVNLSHYLGNMSTTIPSAPGEQARHFAMNSSLAGKSISSIKNAHQIVLYFESTKDTMNTCNPMTSITSISDRGPEVVVMADGSIRSGLTPQQLHSIKEISMHSLQ